MKKLVVIYDKSGSMYGEVEQSYVLVPTRAGFALLREGVQATQMTDTTEVLWRVPVTDLLDAYFKLHGTPPQLVGKEA